MFGGRLSAPEGGSIPVATTNTALQPLRGGGGLQGGRLIFGDVVNESETRVPAAQGQPKGHPLAARGLD